MNYEGLPTAARNVAHAVDFKIALLKRASRFKGKGRG